MVGLYVFGLAWRSVQVLECPWCGEHVRSTQVIGDRLVTVCPNIKHPTYISKAALTLYPEESAQ